MDSRKHECNIETAGNRTKFSSAPVRSVFLFLAGTLCTAVLIEVMPIFSDTMFTSKLVNNDAQYNTSPKQEFALRKFAIYGTSESEDHLYHVIQVLNRLGYERTQIEGDWDLLWAHDYPFISMTNVLKNLQPYQKVNHFPGCGYLTNKVDLSATPLPFLPKAFKLPSQKGSFMKYITDYPTALFVEKHNEHRFIKIKAPHDIDLNSNSSFVQEFIQNPFLVDGHKFDIGVYTLMTSVNPLRVYIYSGDILFRYCKVKYHPFDPHNVDKYVVGDDYLPTWQMPSLIKYWNKFGANMRGAFDAYVRNQNKDPSQVWTQVEDIIRRTVYSKEKLIAALINSYKTKNFFDLMRFDLIIDENLKVYLMEANMSPNLSSAHFKSNSLLYEQVLYSVLNLVGVGSPVNNALVTQNAQDVEEMMSADKNIATLLNVCVDFDCDKSCNVLQCELCLPCLSGADYDILHSSYREHIHRSGMRRIIPKPIDNWKNYDIAEETESLSRKNQWMTRWFYAKCADDSSWCN